MSGTTIVKAIVKCYFIGAIVMSFIHIIDASHKLHTTGWQAFTWPFMIDGIAIIGMIMRGSKWSTETNALGFKVQMGAGLLSLAANIYAGNTTGDVMTGIAVVALFVFAEWLSDRMVTRKEQEEAAAAKVAAAKKEAVNAKRRASRAASKTSKATVRKLRAV